MIVIPPKASPELRRIAAALAGPRWPIRARDAALTRGRQPIALDIREAGFASPQAYSISVTRTGIELTGASPAGLFHGVQTLLQLIGGGETPIACVQIDDWPDFAVRGVMLDISRDKVPTMATLKQLIDGFARLKLNQLQLYTEHTFAYRRHRNVWKHASPITPREAEQLDRYCRERYIELVPNQNCFGHMERWLAHPRYAPLAEATGPWKDPWGTQRNTRTTLNPLDRGSIKLVAELLSELLPHFSSRMVNVGCDETWELGQGRSKAVCRRRGVGRVYLDFLLKIHREVKRHGRAMQFWADIIHEHPELIPELPRDAIPLEWGYEADHPFDDHCAALARAGLRFYVCPGTSSWCSFAGRMDNALTNLRRAAEAGLRHGASGYLITDWGDGGHHQYWPASDIPILYGASVSWCLATNAAIDAARVTSALVFGDPTGTLGGLWRDLGNIYRLAGVELKNATVFFRAMQAEIDPGTGAFKPGPVLFPGLTAASLARLHEALFAMARRLVRFSPQDEYQALVCAEWLQTKLFLDHALTRILAVQNHSFLNAGSPAGTLEESAQDLIHGHRRLWRQRNRPGGLRDSVAGLERLADEYQRLAPPP